MMMMRSSPRSYILTFLLYISVVNEISLPAVNCQDEDGGDQCLPRKTFFALLRLPEVNSNLRAYSRTAETSQDARYRNGIASLRGSISDESDETDVCLPADVYLDLFGDPATWGHLTAIARAQRMLEYPTTRSYVPDIADQESAKRSIATLAKNGDLPISLHLEKTDEEEEEAEEEKRSPATFLLRDSADGSEISREELEALIRLAEIDKRNVAALARDFSLPSFGKRNVAALARDFALPPSNSGKRNVAALARDFALPSSSGKRNVASLARDFSLPYGKRNIAALARDYALPYGKRYLDIFSRGSAPRFQGVGDGKRNLASLVRNSQLPFRSYAKRNLAALARDSGLPIKQNRFGRSLKDYDGNIAEKKLEELASSEGRNSKGKDVLSMAGGNYKIATKFDAKNSSEGEEHHLARHKREIQYSDEYPSPVVQNNNVLDYEEIIEALAGDYPDTEKRFLAAEDPLRMEIDEKEEEPVFGPPAAKRHIGALARLGWLPSFRASRFSRSPRYLVNRENSADGTSADYPADSASRALGLLGRGTTHYSGSRNSGDCRHGFKRLFLVSPLDKLLLQRLYRNKKSP